MLEVTDWHCISCLSETLPFIGIVDDIEYLEALNVKDHFEICWDDIYEKLFNPFTLSANEHDLLPLDNIDPDDNYYNDVYCQ